MPTTPPAEGYPLAVRMPYADGPLTFHDVHAGTRAEFTVEGGVASASTRERAALLMRHGGTPVETDDATATADQDTPPDGSGEESPEGDSKRSTRTSR